MAGNQTTQQKQQQLKECHDDVENDYGKPVKQQQQHSSDDWSFAEALNFAYLQEKVTKVLVKLQYYC